MSALPCSNRLPWLTNGSRPFGLVMCHDRLGRRPVAVGPFDLEAFLANRPSSKATSSGSPWNGAVDSRRASSSLLLRDVWGLVVPWTGPWAGCVWVETSAVPCLMLRSWSLAARVGTATGIRATSRRCRSAALRPSPLCSRFTRRATIKLLYLKTPRLASLSSRPLGRVFDIMPVSDEGG